MKFYYITYTNGEFIFVVKRPEQYLGETITAIIDQKETIICVALVP